MNIKVNPLELFFNKFLNSLCNFKLILFHSNLVRDGMNQNIGGMIINPIIVLVQFKDIFQFDEGSKDENKFIIIFNLTFLIFWRF